MSEKMIRNERKVKEPAEERVLAHKLGRELKRDEMDKVGGAGWTFNAGIDYKWRF